MYCEKVDFFSHLRLSHLIARFFSSLPLMFSGSPPVLIPQTYFVLSPHVPCASFNVVFSLRHTLAPSVPLPLTLLVLSHTFSHAFLSPHLPPSRVSPPTCSTELCLVPCGSHGVCSEGQCQCEEGWIGAACDQRACHPRCEEHGQCHDGTCICQPGWEGEHCNIGESGAAARGTVYMSPVI